MIPGPRPADGLLRPSAGSEDRPARLSDTGCAPVALVRTPAGWVVRSIGPSSVVGDLVEGMSLADLVAEELGAPPEPDRSARRSARGAAAVPDEPPDPAAARIAVLERTVAQLEHALAARVATERAIGVLAERHGVSARAAFEELRRDARSQGRPVAELAREVLDGLPADTPRPAPVVDTPVVIGAADGRS